jgi:hypothetical protein
MTMSGATNSMTGTATPTSPNPYDEMLFNPAPTDEVGELTIDPAELKHMSLEVGGWLWGTVKGCFNRKMTTSQIIVDAIIGVIPVVGDITAARDLIAVVIGMIREPERRKEVLEWVLLVVLLLALIPVAGGVLKGVGRLLTKGAKTAAESRGLLKEIILVLNRLGIGDAAKFIKELELLKYERQVVREFGNLMDRFTLVFEKIETKLGWFIPKEMKELLAIYKKAVKELKELGSKMVPDAIKELDKRLKSIQHMIYEGEIFGIQGTGKAVTREAEARLVESSALRAAQREMKYPKNAAEVGKEWMFEKHYKSKPGWPNLMKEPKGGVYTKIESFSGPIEAKTIPGPYDITRYFDKEAAYPTGAYWVPQEVHFKNAKEWRTQGAVLDSWNKDGYRVTCHIPENFNNPLRAWEGKVSSQFDEKVGQFLEGGAKQLFVDLGLSSDELKKINELGRSGAKEVTASNGLIFKFEETGWTDSVHIYGFEPTVRDVVNVATDKLGKYERETKMLRGGVRLLQLETTPADSIAKGK